MTVEISRTGPVTTVVLNRPHARNAVDGPTARALYAAFEEFDADDTAAVAVLCGAGGTFCAGADLKAIGTENTNPTHPDTALAPMGPTRMVLSKPVIAAVEGYAVAGGLELALWCDLRVASQTARFGVFCRRWGVPLVDGGTVRLPRLIGQSRALDMILTGREVGAREAFDWGLANRLAPAGGALAEAKRVAAQLTTFPQLCLRSDRRSSYEQWGLGLGDALIHEGRLGMPALQAEARKGAARFVAGKGRSGDFGDI